MNERIRVVLRSAVTYITLTMLVAQAAITELPLGEGAVRFIARVIAFLSAVVVIIRRTVEVPKNKRGIL